MIPPFMFQPHIPKDAGPGLLLAYCVIYAGFAWGMCAVTAHFVFTWHRDFDEWLWGIGILSAVLVVPAVLLTGMAIEIWRETWG